MNLKNLLTLTIRVQDYNLVAAKPDFLQKLRKLTLDPYSGMNYELNNFERIRRVRPVDCDILTAFRLDNLVAWALLSRERSDYRYPNTHNGYNPTDGYLFQVYVHPSVRKQEIGTELIKVARRKANGTRLCVCPHDSVSDKFFDKFKNFKNKEL